LANSTISPTRRIHYKRRQRSRGGRQSHRHLPKARNINGGDNTAFIDQIAVVQQPTGSPDSGFEASVVNPGSFKYKPDGFILDIQRHGRPLPPAKGDFTSATPMPARRTSRFPSNQTSSMSQTVTFTAGTYAIGFAAAQRANFASDQTFQVLIDGNLIGSYGGLTGAGLLVLIHHWLFRHGRQPHHHVPGHQSPRRRQHRLH